MGLLDPATSDGRVIFFLPWLRGTSKLIIIIFKEMSDNKNYFMV